MTTAWGWIYLFVSGVVDVVWALSMKKADGFANPGWSAVSLALLALFVYLLTKSLVVLPIGTAYAVWTGIGAVGTVLAGALFFSEPVTIARLVCIALIIVGIAGLKVLPD